MSPDMPESLEERIAPASLVNAAAPAESSARSPEQPFLGAAEGGNAAAEPGSISAAALSIGEGRVITDVSPSMVSPAFRDTVPTVASGALGVTLELRNPLADDLAAGIGTSGILNTSSGDARTSSDPLALGQDAGLSALTTIEGLSSPVLLVDVPRISPAL